MNIELINEIAEVVNKFDYDFDQIDNHRTWSYWQYRKQDYMNMIRKQLTQEEKLALYHRVAELHNIAVEPYLQYGNCKKFDEDTVKQQNVRYFIGNIEFL